MASDFGLSSEYTGDCLILSTTGYINSDGGDQILAKIQEALARDINRVVINLMDSKVINSIGISFLIESIELLMNAGGRMVFANLDPSVEKALQIMGLFHFAGKASSVEDAHADLN
ncbi:MAG: STAS domain-containing protein [Acidobacteria bacterium]|nr:STAS domain-containing protein [Acidobacteriota bacterium]